MSKTFLETDVFVAGGGPAGLAAAIAARLAGFRVAVADRRRPPIDKACGEGIMPDGVALLDQLGVVLPFGSAVPFAGIRFSEGGLAATGRFRGGKGIGVRRTVLHRAMMRRADELGVVCLWEHKVLGLHPEGAELANGMVRSRWVVGADGKNSRIRHGLGLDTPPLHQRVGIRRHYEIPPWSDLVEVHWSTGCEAYVTPVGGRLVCLAMLLDDPSLRFDQALDRFPELSRRLRGESGISRDLGDITVTRRNLRVVNGRVALVGEASGSVDAITGEGITLALHQAMALTQSLLQDDLGVYSRRHRRLMRLPNRMAALLLAIDHRPRLRRWALWTLARLPAFFSQLLALHTRALPMMSPAAPLSLAGIGHLPGTLGAAESGTSGPDRPCNLISKERR
jgi:flavin-dependent dehydrogenase